MSCQEQASWLQLKIETRACVSCPESHTFFSEGSFRNAINDRPLKTVTRQLQALKVCYTSGLSSLCGLEFDSRRKPNVQTYWNPSVASYTVGIESDTDHSFTHSPPDNAQTKNERTLISITSVFRQENNFKYIFFPATATSVTNFDVKYFVICSQKRTSLTRLIFKITYTENLRRLLAFKDLEHLSQHSV
jgi:hypothetical protein